MAKYENIPGSSARQKRAAAMAAREEGFPLTPPSSDRQRLAEAKSRGKPTAEQRKAAATARRKAKAAEDAKRAQERIAAQHRTDVAAGVGRSGIAEQGLRARDDVEARSARAAEQARLILERERKQRGS